jgi:hypothetical protein
MSQIEAWLNKCLVEHSQCSQVAMTSTSIPSRLLRIDQTVDGTIHARLVSAAGNDYSTHVKYAALSHRWFEGDSMQLVFTNTAQFRDYIPTQLLKPAVRDAMKVAIYLNMQYLWVDSLCIIQDDDDDRAQEVAAMADIYSQAVFTIAASGADRKDEGCFFNRDITSVTNYYIKMGCHSTVSSTHLLRLHWNGRNISSSDGYTELRNCTLAGRAWVYQERFLSTRTVHFCRSQVHWECTELLASETYPEGKPQRDSENEDSLKQVLKLKDVQAFNAAQRRSATIRFWFNIVQEYSRRSLTFENDRMDAITGVASFFKRLTGDEYIAGIWKSSFPNSLLWSVNSNPKACKPLRNLAPSWSWCGITGRVIFLASHRADIEKAVSHVKLVESPDLFPQDTTLESSRSTIKDWHWIPLRILALVFRGFLTKDPDHDNSFGFNPKCIISPYEEDGTLDQDVQIDGWLDLLRSLDSI